MHKLAAVFALLASPALATGLEIEIEGEGANGTVTVDLSVTDAVDQVWVDDQQRVVGLGRVAAGEPPVCM